MLWFENFSSQITICSSRFSHFTFFFSFSVSTRTVFTRFVCYPSPFVIPKKIKSPCPISMERTMDFTDFSAQIPNIQWNSSGEKNGRIYCSFAGHSHFQSIHNLWWHISALSKQLWRIVLWIGQMSYNFWCSLFNGFEVFNKWWWT